MMPSESNHGVVDVMMIYSHLHTRYMEMEQVIEFDLSIYQQR